MNTFFMMAAFCLASVWIATLLCIGDALIDWRSLEGLRVRIAQRLRHATVRHINGASPSLATHLLEQRARQLDGDLPALGLWDHAWTSVFHGGTLVVDGVATEVPPGPAVVWPDTKAQAAAGQLSQVAFERLFEEANGARGAMRTIATGVGAVGETVWFVAHDTGSVMISAINPLGWIRRQQLRCLAFVGLGLVWAASGTALAFSGDPFGVAAKAGAVLLIALFLGLSPLLVKLRDACRTPDQALVAGRLHGLATPTRAHSTSSAFRDT